MVNLVQMPVVTHNLHGPDRDVTRRHQTIAVFLNACRGGMGGFNELSKKDHAHIRQEAYKLNLKIRIHGEDGAVWDPTKLHLNKIHVKKIMTGGHVGADGVHTARSGDDDRRVGPNRYAMYLSFTAYAIGLNFEFVVTHPMARAFTSQRWRQTLFKKSIKSLAQGLSEPNGVMVGDMNSPGFINLPSVANVSVHTPSSMGHNHYDQILYWGDHISVNRVKAVNTPSDHRLIKSAATFYKNPKTK